MISTDPQQVVRYFTEVYSPQPLCSMANPIHNIELHPEFAGTTDSADFLGPIARPVSGEFHHFFTQIATEYDGDPSPTVADYSRRGGTADSADFQGRIARPVSDDFRHFFTQIAAEYSLRAGDSPYVRSTRFCHLFISFHAKNASKSTNTA